MRILILLGLSVLAAVCNADSSESNEIDDVLFLGRGDAYSFMRPASRWYPWERARVKPIYEVNREQCEEYPLCDHLTRQVNGRYAQSRRFGGGWMRPGSHGQLRPHRQRGYRSRKQYYGY
ncbi:matrix Gla protein-like [Mobula hypostoma]|uniref:matrix Gla protein-like n=1 Tax=Mobula hypostoma TaxID=723540 RepID=UPI002FC3088C